MKTVPGMYTRRNGTKCAIKVFRQPCDTFTGMLGDQMRFIGRSYGGWRYWCLICNAYEWSGRDVASAMDGARAHCREHEWRPA